MQVKHFLFQLIIICMMGSVIPAAAETKSSSDDWHFSLTPFFLQGIIFDEQSHVDRQNRSQSLSFSNDFLSSDSQGQKIKLQAQKNDWTLFADYQYDQPDPTVKILPESELLDLKAQITELGASYRFATWSSTEFEVLAGTRYKKQLTDPSFATRPQNQIVANDSWWQNTFVGLRFFSHISDKWTFIGRGDIGAGTNNNNIAWNVAAMFDYSLDDWGSFYFGYKLLDFDDKNVDTGRERYSYDALEQGPFIGFSIRW